MLRDVSTYSKDFASWGFATQGTIGEFFALVIKATSVEQKTTFDKGEPYLEVHGVDMDRSIWYSGEYTGAFVIRVTKVVEVAERKAAWAASDVNATWLCVGCHGQRLRLSSTEAVKLALGFSKRMADKAAHQERYR